MNDSLMERLAVLQDAVNDPRSAEPSDNSGSGGISIETASQHDQESTVLEEEVTSPRIDKGKGRAEPEPEKIAEIFAPSFKVEDSDEDEEYHGQQGAGVLSLGGLPTLDPSAPERIGMPSPTER